MKLFGLYHILEYQCHKNPLRSANPTSVAMIYSIKPFTIQYLSYLLIKSFGGKRSACSFSSCWSVRLSHSTALTFGYLLFYLLLSCSQWNRVELTTIPPCQCPTSSSNLAPRSLALSLCGHISKLNLFLPSSPTT